MSDFWLALKNYLYGIGWLFIAFQAIAYGLRLFVRVCPLDIRHEIAAKNMAAAVMVGLFLFGLAFGVLYFVAHVQ
jgi:ABC-type sulfate transport system permease component